SFKISFVSCCTDTLVHWKLAEKKIQGFPVIHLLQLEDETNFAALFNGCVALRAELVSLGCVNGFVSEVGAGGITLRAPFSRQNISLPINRDVKHNSTFFFSILDAV